MSGPRSSGERWSITARIIDGNIDGTPTVDIGAYEYLPGEVSYDGKVNVVDLLLALEQMRRWPRGDCPSLR